MPTLSQNDSPVSQSVRPIWEILVYTEAPFEDLFRWSLLYYWLGEIAYTEYKREMVIHLSFWLLEFASVIMDKPVY